MSQQQRPIYQIAFEIAKDWKTPYFGAVPYINAMKSINNIDDMYGEDTAKSILCYFLANAQTWRGEVARRVKAEIKQLTS